MDGREDVKIIHCAEEEQGIIVAHDRHFGQLLIAQARVNVWDHLPPSGSHRSSVHTRDPVGPLPIRSTRFSLHHPLFIVVAERQKQRVNVRIRTLS
jgi:hypothetical protein